MGGRGSERRCVRRALPNAVQMLGTPFGLSLSKPNRKSQFLRQGARKQVALPAQQPA